MYMQMAITVTIMLVLYITKFFLEKQDILILDLSSPHFSTKYDNLKMFETITLQEEKLHTTSFHEWLHYCHAFMQS